MCVACEEREVKGGERREEREGSRLLKNRKRRMDDEY